MINPLLRKTIFISLAGHLALFNIFNFSFGRMMLPADFAKVSSFGRILTERDLLAFRPQIRFSKASILALDRVKQANGSAAAPSVTGLKPAIDFSFSPNKLPFFEKSASGPPARKEKETPLMFYPHLPYYFTLYFKDRQTVHIELLFKITSQSVIVKRKISSGNLQADLLSMRYIQRYLFIQKAGLTQNKWESVKIDLSQKND